MNLSSVLFVHYERDRFVLESLTWRWRYPIVLWPENISNEPWKEIFFES